MTATTLQDNLFGVINSLPISEYESSTYGKDALSILQNANYYISENINYFWKIPFSEKKINYELLDELVSSLKILQKISTDRSISEELQQEASKLIDNILDYKKLLSDYFEERELILSNSKRMISSILEKNKY